MCSNRDRRWLDPEGPRRRQEAEQAWIPLPLVGVATRQPLSQGKAADSSARRYLPEPHREGAHKSYRYGGVRRTSSRPGFSTFIRDRGSEGTWTRDLMEPRLPDESNRFKAPNSPRILVSCGLVRRTPVLPRIPERR